LYDNKNAENLEKTLNEKGSTRLIYDYGKNHYWEVKKHIDRSLRDRVPSPTSVSAIGIFENENDIDKCNKKVSSLLLNTIFTKKDKDDLEKEYEELEKEIKNICNDNWIPIYHF
jgi:chromosome segregation ATPase